MVEGGIMSPGYQDCYIPQAKGFLARARKAFKDAFPDCHTCAICEVIKMRYMEIHHLDEDISNNDINNLQMLCRPCHAHLHGLD